jgi:uncharacterized membrane protein
VSPFAIYVIVAGAQPNFALGISAVLLVGGGVAAVRTRHDRVKATAHPVVWARAQAVAGVVLVVIGTASLIRAFGG